MLKATFAICALAICGSINLQAEEIESAQAIEINQDADQQQEMKKKTQEDANGTEEAPLAKEKEEGSKEEALACCKDECKKRHA